MQKWSLKKVTRSVWVSFSWERKWIVIKSSRKNWKSFKNCPYYAKHAFFVTKVSRQSVTRVNRQNTSSQKFWKNLLRVFHDWKSHLRGSHELSRENLCVPLVTGPSTREQVAKIDLRARDCGMLLGWPATELPKEGNTVFFVVEIFNFCKNKILSKNT